MSTVIDFLSAKRLSKHGNPEYARTQAQYFFNVRLCESFYPSISQFEVALRNKIDQVFTRHMGANWIFDFVAADERLTTEKQITDRDELIDSMTFAFWSRLFMQERDTDIWRKYPTALSEIFENRKEALILSKVSYEIEQIRRYRNRLSHNGSLLICSKRQMSCHKIHNLLLRMMREMGASPLLNQIKKIDRFNEVFTDGKNLGFITCKL